MVRVTIKGGSLQLTCFHTACKSRLHLAKCSSMQSAEYGCLLHVCVAGGIWKNTEVGHDLAAVLLYLCAVSCAHSCLTKADSKNA